MKTHLTIQDSFNEDVLSSSAPDGVVEACIKRERNLFTQVQYKDLIGQLTDPTSEASKPLIKQKRLFSTVVYMLDDFCRRSNGGRLSAEINQVELLKRKINGKCPNRVLTNRALKFCKHHDILREHIPAIPQEHATFYIGGLFMIEHLTAVKLKKEGMSRYMKKRIDYMTNMGFNPNEIKTCGCCMNKLPLYNFDIGEKFGGLNVVPVCKGCNTKWQHDKQNRPVGYNTAWRAYYAEYENQEVVMLTEYTREQMEDEVNEKILKDL